MTQQKPKAYLNPKDRVPVRNVYLTPDLDRSKVVADAIARAKGDDRNKPEKVVVHHHPHSLHCNTETGHDVYNPMPQKGVKK